MERTSFDQGALTRVSSASRLYILAFEETVSLQLFPTVITVCSVGFVLIREA